MSDHNAAKQAESLAWATRDHLPWTPEDDRIIRDNSWSLTEMARQTQRTYYAVDSRRKVLGIKMRDSNGRAPAVTPESPFDFDPDTVCPDCFTIRAAAGDCLC